MASVHGGCVSRRYKKKPGQSAGLRSQIKLGVSRDLRTIFKRAGLAPHVDEGLADEIFGAIGVDPKTDDEVVNANVMPEVQRPHGGLASRRNRLDKVVVGLLVRRII
jgi:hypothetical protein